VLIGFNQKVYGGLICSLFRSQGHRAIGGKTEPNPLSLLMRNTVNPDLRPKGKLTARKADGGWVEDGGKSECHSVIEWIGIVILFQSVTMQTSTWSLITREFVEPFY